MRQFRLKKAVSFLLTAAMMFIILAVPFTSETQAATKAIKVTNVSGSTKILMQGSSFTLKTNYAAGKLTFKSSKPAIVTVNSKGRLRAKAEGTAKITVTLKANKKVKKSLDIKIYEPIIISQKGMERSVFTGTDGMHQSIATNYKKSELIFTSSNPEVATVDAKGVMNINAEGAAKIVVALKANEEVSCEIVVINKEGVRRIKNGAIKEKYNKETNKSDYQIFIAKDRYDHDINLAFEIKGAAPEFRVTGMAGEMYSNSAGCALDARKVDIDPDQLKGMSDNDRKALCNDLFTGTDCILDEIMTEETDSEYRIYYTYKTSDGEFYGIASLIHEKKTNNVYAFDYISRKALSQSESLEIIKSITIEDFSIEDLGK